MMNRTKREEAYYNKVEKLQKLVAVYKGLNIMIKQPRNYDKGKLIICEDINRKQRKQIEKLKTSLVIIENKLSYQEEIMKAAKEIFKIEYTLEMETYENDRYIAIENLLKAVKALKETD